MPWLPAVIQGQQLLGVLVGCQSSEEGVVFYRLLPAPFVARWVGYFALERLREH